MNAAVRHEPDPPEQAYGLALDDVLRGFGHIGHDIGDCRKTHKTATAG